MNEINNHLAPISFAAVLPRATILILVCLTALSSPALRAQPAQKPPPPAARRPLPKLSNGARGFDTSQKDATARLIAVGGGYGAGEEEGPLPKLKRNTADGYYQWGLELYGVAHNQAVTAFERAIKLNPKMVKAYWKLGNAYSEYNELADESKYDDEECYRRAIAAFEQVRRLQPGRAGVYNNLGILYFNIGQYEKSITAFQTGLRLKPKGAKNNNASLRESEYLTDAEIYVFIGDAHERLDQNALALKFYQRASQFRDDPTFYMPDFDERLGLVYEKLGEVDKAIAAYKGLFDELSKKVEYFDMREDLAQRLGMLYAAKGNYDQAIECFDGAISYYTGYLESSKVSAPTPTVDNAEQVRYWKEDEQRASATLASAAYNLGVVYLTLNRQEKAAAAFQRAVEANPNHAGAHFNLGYAYLTLGDKAAAAKELKTLQSLDLDLSKELEGLLTRPGQ